MKFKPLYVYGIVIIIIAVILVITSNSDSTEVVQDPQTTMPQDNIHEGLSGNENMGGPSGSNVRQDFWDRLDSLDNYVTNNPNDTLTKKEYAGLLSMAHKTDRALEIYESILEVNPERIDILLAKSIIYFNTQDLDKSEEVTEKILSINSNYLEAKFNLGVIYISKGDTVGARNTWEDLIKENPNTDAGNAAVEALQRIEK